MFNYDIHTVISIDSGKFEVASETQKRVYVVDLMKPMCECDDWQCNHLPCKHMLVIVSSIRGSWQCIPPAYRESPMFTLDRGIVGSSGEQGLSDDASNQQDTFPQREESSESDTFLQHESTPSAGEESEVKQIREMTADITRLSYLLPEDNPELPIILKKLGKVNQLLSKNIHHHSAGWPQLPKKRKMKKKSKLGNIEEHVSYTINIIETIMVSVIFNVVILWSLLFF